MAKRRRIPKRIGGAKVPKPLRRHAETLLAWADHPVASQAIAAALVGAAAAIMDGKDRRGILKAAGLGAGAAAVKAAKGADRIGLALAIAASEIAAGRSGFGKKDGPKKR
jgi:hypothetical protein